MDLKTYAVHRKLEQGDDLLPYVVDGTPVPIPVVESCFGSFIEGMEDKRAERLLTNYPKMLSEDVPVVTLRNEETGGYEISGDIPDRMVEAIECVYKVDPEEIVRAFTAYRLNVIHGQDCEILDTSCSERARHVVDDLKEQLRDVTEQLQDVTAKQEDEAADVVEPFESETLEPETVTEVTEPEFSSEFEERPEAASEALESDDVLNFDAEESIENVEDVPVEEEAPSENAPDFGTEEVQAEDMPDSVIDEPAESASDFDVDEPAESVSDFDIDEPDEQTELVTEEEIAEETSGEETDLDKAFDEGEAYDFANEPDQGADLSAALRRVYDRFCEDLRQYGLDKRLNLAM